MAKKLKDGASVRSQMQALEPGQAMAVPLGRMPVSSLRSMAASLKQDQKGTYSVTHDEKSETTTITRVS